MMNSPVPCLPDPIQSMVKKGQKKKKTIPRRRPVERLVQQMRPPQNTQALNKGFGVPGTAYGAVMGPKKILPLTSGMGSNMVVANYEQIVVGSGLTGTGSFNIGGLVTNAGLIGNWPWLGSIADNFQKFRFRSLRFIFVPACPTTTPGSMFLYMSYDSKDTPPANLAAVTASESAVVGNAWYGGPINPDVAFSDKLSLKDNIYLDVDCSKFTQPWYYTRKNHADTLNTVQLTGTPTGGIGTPALASAGTYEYTARPGIIYFGTDSVTNSVVTGNLYMAYVAEFTNPILASLNV